jgi:ribonuclease HII
MAPARGRANGRRPAARLFAHDRGFGARRVAGADEAGRGCLAGPLVVAAVCLDLEGLTPRGRRSLSDLDDSKRLAPDVRARVAEAIMRHAERMAGPMANAYPGFGFDQHVGYATPEHHAALRSEGLSPLHRRSFQSIAYSQLELG